MQHSDSFCRRNLQKLFLGFFLYIFKILFITTPCVNPSFTPLKKGVNFQEMLPYNSLGMDLEITFFKSINFHKMGVSHTNFSNKKNKHFPYPH